MLSKDRPILVLAPHTDDGELGCGGSISRLVREGYQVHYVAFCNCDESLLPGFAPGTLRHELLAATAELGIPRSNVDILDFKVRNLPASRQDILEHLVKINRSLKPQLVFCPTIVDVHQDHEALAKEAVRAFKSNTVLGYEMPWNNIVFEASFLIRLKAEDVTCKIAALNKYASQQHRDYMAPAYIEGHARMRGVTIGADYAEAFTVYRGVM